MMVITRDYSGAEKFQLPSDFGAPCIVTWCTGEAGVNKPAAPVIQAAHRPLV
jgi:hypothetical protein